jgi:Transcriptional regulatory protein, C terminal/GAF domain
MNVASDLLTPLPPIGAPPVASLQHVAAELTESVGAEQIGEAVANAGISGLGARVAVVAVRTGDDPQYRAVHTRGLSGVARQRVAAVPADGGGFIAKVGRSREELFLHSAADTNSPPSRDAPALLTRGALVGLPIARESRGIGVVVFGWPHTRAFSDDERAFLTVLKGLCALALDRLHLAAERDRLRARLARASMPGGDTGAHLDVGDMHVDLAGHRVLIGDRTINLTPTELSLLAYLAGEPGRARSRREILRHLWHTEHVGDERVCDAHISNLRHKIERDPARPERVVTRRGVGYSLRVH